MIPVIKAVLFFIAIAFRDKKLFKFCLKFSCAKATQSWSVHSMDEPSWISTHIQLWGQKPQLRYFYEQEIFRRIVAFSIHKGVSIEIGSGPGFLKSTIPNLICTDIENGPTVDCLVDATQLPFKNNSVDTLIGVDVLHHFDQPGSFFEMASRSLKPGGVSFL